MTEEAQRLLEVVQRARTEVGKIIIGQEEVIEQALIVLLSGQHALIEGVPGVGKTLLIRTLAHVLGCDFGRIQFTPDLMPTDITGTNVFNLKANEFNLVKGPIFTTFLLADEINRAPAKTQSALLQCMQERTVTIDTTTHQLDENFTVFATQNPVEYEGTYPLPEAQKDRFMLKIQMEYPNEQQELDLARQMLGARTPEKRLALGELTPVISMGELAAIRGLLLNITLRDELLNYLVRIVRATRTHQSVLVGAGPRATQALLFAARGFAVLDERDFVTPDDVRAAAPAVLGHRIILRPEYEIEGLTVNELVQRIVQEIPVPR